MLDLLASLDQLPVGIGILKPFFSSNERGRYSTQGSQSLNCEETRPQR